jgi:hypothetical protein
MARSSKEIARIVVDRIGWDKMMGNSCLTDFDPLVTVMCLIANEIGEKNIVKPKGQKVWLEAMQDIQEDGGAIENNPFFPCPHCDQSFEPVIDEQTFKLFLQWYQTRGTEDLVALHKCPKCGGQVQAKRIQINKGDMHTPEPGYAKSDEHWAELLLEHCDA